MPPATLSAVLLVSVSNNTHRLHLLLTSVEAANSARHRLSEDHAAITRGGAVFNVRIVIHGDL